MVYLFCQNDPEKWVGMSRLEQHTPIQTKSEYPQALNIEFEGSWYSKTSAPEALRQAPEPHPLHASLHLFSF